MLGLILVMISFLAGIAGYAFGGGFGTIPVPALILLGFGARETILSVLIAQFFGEFTSIMMHHRLRNADFSLNSNDMKQGIILGTCGFAGLVGAFIAMTIPERIIVSYEVILLISLGLVVIAWENHVYVRNVPSSKIITIGALASLNKAITGGNYRPTIIALSILLGADAKRVIAVVSLAGSIVCVFSIIGYIIYGMKISLGLLIYITVGSVASATLSAFLARKIPTRFLRVLIGVTMAALGLCLLFRTIS